MKIAFVADGGLDLGMGHIYRTLSLAEELPGDSDKIFLTKSEEHVVKKIEANGFETLRCGNDFEILANLSAIDPEVVVVDRLDIKEEFAHDIKIGTNTRLVAFENLVPESSKYCDVVVNAVLGNRFGSEVKNKRFFDFKTNTLYFYGVKYLLLKDAFYKCGVKSKPSGVRSIDSIVLIFGGSDPSNLTGAVLCELLKMKWETKIDIILGYHFVYSDCVDEIMSKFVYSKNNVILHHDANNVAELMHETDLVISAPGISVFEALYVGTPVIVIHQNKWQKDGFRGYRKTLGKEDVFRIADLIENREFWSPDDDFTKGLEIGRGKNEVIHEILKG